MSKTQRNKTKKEHTLKSKTYTLKGIETKRLSALPAAVKKDARKRKKFPGGKIADHLVEHKMKYYRGSLIAMAAMLVITFVATRIAAVYPYALEVNDEPVCYVKNEKVAEKVINEIVNDYLPEESKVVAVISDNTLKLNKAEAAFKVYKETVSDEQAVEIVKEAFNENRSEDTGVTIISNKQEERKYTPEPKYIKDDSMLAGDSEVEKKGKKGKELVTIQLKSFNGEIQEKNEVGTEVLEEGKPATVRKGTLGLPEGEDWKTYEGDPIFKDGEDLTKTALNYLGAPYKYGGYSLTHGIDCVQFIRQMYAKYGIRLPNGKNALKHVGTSVSYGNAKKGDIICYSNHYALYLGNGKIVHATHGKGVHVSNNAKFRNIVTIRRVVK